jgi:hypothetical protein
MGALRSSVSGYEKIGEEDWTREDNPADWANTQNKLALALSSLGEMANDPKRIEEAVAAYRDALEVYIRENNPASWATINYQMEPH